MKYVPILNRAYFESIEAARKSAEAWEAAQRDPATIAARERTARADAAWAKADADTRRRARAHPGIWDDPDGAAGIVLDGLVA